MASTIQIKRGTGSAVPSGLADGELAINLDKGQLYFGSGSTSVNSFTFKNLTAENYIVSSSVTHLTTQTLSGSTEFGDDSVDIHNRTGSLNISGALNLNGPVNAITVTGNINANGNIVGDDNTNITNISQIECDVIASDANSTTKFQLENTSILALVNDTDVFDVSETIFTHYIPVKFNSHITSSGNISASGDIYGDRFYSNNVQVIRNNNGINYFGKTGVPTELAGNVTASGNISSSGFISASSANIGTIVAAQITGTSGLTGTLQTAAQANVTSVGTLSSLTVSGDVTANGNIVGDGATDISGIDTITTTGNISSSAGTISAPAFNVDGIAALDTNVTTGRLFVNSTTTQVDIGKVGTITSTKFNSDVTASGAISASGAIIAASANITDYGDISSATIRLSSTTDASVSSTAHAFQAGATNSTNVIIDNNEIMARNNGAVSGLHVNPDGGNITFNNSVSDKVIIGSGNVTASGNISASGNLISNEIKINTIQSHDSVGVVELKGDNVGSVLKIHSTNDIGNRVVGLEMSASGDGHVFSLGLGRGNVDGVGTFVIAPTVVSTAEANAVFEMDITGNITSSGIISASGNLLAASISAHGHNIGFFDGTSIGLGYENNTPIQIGKLANPTTFVGNITASGTISSSGDIMAGGTIQAGWHGSTTRIKILVSDFIPDDIGRPAMIDDSGSDRWLESHGTGILFASLPIPTGFKATHVHIYGSGTSALEVSEMNINSKTVTGKGTGNIGTELDITDVTSSTTNYLLLELAQASGEEVYGGYVTIEAV